MKVYHGTIENAAKNIIKNGILLSKSKQFLDFGRGFYTTPDIKFAKSTAKYKANRTNLFNDNNLCVPCVLEFDYNEDGYKKLGLNTLRFDCVDLEWAQFIVNNRNGQEYVNAISSTNHNLYAQYDIVIGSIADNKITTIASELLSLNEKIGVMDFLNINYPYNTNQISFHTEESLSCISLVKYDIIKQKGGTNDGR